MNETLNKYEGLVKIGGKMFTNLGFADDIDGLESSELEPVSVTSNLDHTAKEYDMDINETKMNIMTNSEGHFNSEIKINDKTLKIVE